MIGSQTCQLGLWLRVTCEKNLISNGTSTVGASSINRCCPNHVIPGFSVRAMWPTSNHHFLPFCPLKSVCIISRFLVSIFCSRSVYLQISAIPMAFICLIIWILCSVWKLTVKLQQWWKAHSCSLSQDLSARVNCRSVSPHIAKPDRLKPPSSVGRLTFTCHMFFPGPKQDLTVGLQTVNILVRVSSQLLPCP